MKEQKGCGKKTDRVKFNPNGRGYYHPICGENKYLCQECLDKYYNKKEDGLPPKSVGIRPAIL